MDERRFDACVRESTGLQVTFDTTVDDACGIAGTDDIGAAADSQRFSISAALRALQQVPLWPAHESVVDEDVAKIAMLDVKAQAFVRHASRASVSERCAREVAVISTEPLCFWFGYVINSLSASCLMTLVYTWHLHSLGVPFLMTVPGMLSGISLWVHYWGSARWGPASLAWSWLGIVVLAIIVCGGSFGVLACLFVAEDQMIFNSRIARVCISTIVLVNANNWAYVSIPRVDGVTVSFAVAMGWHSLIRGLRFADCLSDLEISSVLFREAQSGECIWTNATRRCDLYIAMGVGNLVCGLLDYAMAATITLFGKFLQSDSRQYKIVNATIHIVSLGLELVIFAINVYYTFVVAPLSAEDPSGGTTKTVLVYYIVSLILTVVSCYINILGARRVLAEMRKVASSAVSIVQSRSGSASALWRGSRAGRQNTRGLGFPTISATRSGEAGSAAFEKSTERAHSADGELISVKLPSLRTAKVRPDACSGAAYTSAVLLPLQDG